MRDEGCGIQDAGVPKNERTYCSIFTSPLAPLLSKSKGLLWRRGDRGKVVLKTNIVSIILLTGLLELTPNLRQRRTGLS